MSNLPSASFSPVTGTDQDHRECLRLMQKVYGCGVLKAMVDFVLEQTPPGQSVVREPMNDESKRQRDGNDEKLMGSHDAPPVTTNIPPPTTSARYGSNGPELPPGVSSLEMWGRPKITFGKLKDKLTYSGLHLLQVLACSPFRERISTTARFGEVFDRDARSSGACPCSWRYGRGDPRHRHSS